MDSKRRNELLSQSVTGREILASEPAAGIRAMGDEDLGAITDPRDRSLLAEAIAAGLRDLAGLLPRILARVAQERRIRDMSGGNIATGSLREAMIHEVERFAIEHTAYRAKALAILQAIRDFR